jgi:hypothetical protein
LPLSNAPATSALISEVSANGDAVDITHELP